MTVSTTSAFSAAPGEATSCINDQERANDDRVIEVDRTVARRDGRQAEQENEH
jgi:hypothetical protein